MGNPPAVLQISWKNVIVMYGGSVAGRSEQLSVYDVTRYLTTGPISRKQLPRTVVAVDYHTSHLAVPSLSTLRGCVRVLHYIYAIDPSLAHCESR